MSTPSLPCELYPFSGVLPLFLVVCVLDVDVTLYFYDKYRVLQIDVTSR